MMSPIYTNISQFKTKITKNLNLYHSRICIINLINRKENGFKPHQVILKPSQKIKPAIYEIFSYKQIHNCCK